AGRRALFVRAPRLGLAKLARQDLGRMGRAVRVKRSPPAVLLDKISSPGEPWDLTIFGWEGNWIDPYFYLNGQLASSKIPGRGPDNSNISSFDNPRFERALQRDSRLSGGARYRAYGRLAVRLAREAAPMAAFAVRDDHSLLSNRVGCFTTNFYGLDLAALCPKS